MRRRLIILLFAVSISSQGALEAAPPQNGGLPQNGALPAIPVVPTTPQEFKQRGIGTGNVGLGAVQPPPPPPPKVTTRFEYIAVSPEREWSNPEGKRIRGALLAFEEGAIEKVKRPVTLIKNGNVRLLRTGMKVPDVFPMSLLSAEDQEFIRKLDKVNQEAAKPRGPAA